MIKRRETVILSTGEGMEFRIIGIYKAAKDFDKNHIEKRRD